MNRFLFFLFFISFISCQAQESYSELANRINSTITNELILERKTLIQTGRDLTIYLPKNYIKDGTVDYTKEIQSGINKGGVVVLPNIPLLINKSGLNIPSNTKLIFREKSKLIMKPNSETHYTIIDIKNVKNVEVYFANILGDRQKHLVKKGEWGMGLRIQGSKNVNIYAPNIEECWGDGIYIGPLGNVNSENVSISNFKIRKSRRNGISVISVNKLSIMDGVISETGGTAPQSGIDFEPNKHTNILKEIYIKNLITHNSGGDGIMFALSNLTLKGVLRPEGNSKDVSITIDNHLDIGSKYAARINGRDNNYNSKFEKNYKISGNITFNNPIWKGTESPTPVRYSPKEDRVLEYGFNPEILFNNIRLLDKKGLNEINKSKIVNEIMKQSKVL